jgi:protein-L-isoaspartate(D-aspartate) O-methyltransferase
MRLPLGAQARKMIAPEAEAMVVQQIAGRGICDEKVLAAMKRVDRRLFVEPKNAARAFNDHPIPIGLGQTISQPYIVAFMTEALQLTANDRVLEIGTGCGYQTAILAEIAQEVCTMEIIEDLGREAGNLLAQLGYVNLQTRIGDGRNGWSEKISFDKIIATAAPEQVPDALLRQLKIGGLLVMPVGTEEQELVRIRRSKKGIERESLLPVRFVPMTGSNS